LASSASQEADEHLGFKEAKYLEVYKVIKQNGITISKVLMDVLLLIVNRIIKLGFCPSVNFLA